MFLLNQTPCASFQGPRAHLRGDFEADIRLHRCHMLLGNADGYLQVFGKFHFDSLVSPVVMKKQLQHRDIVRGSRPFTSFIQIKLSLLVTGQQPHRGPLQKREGALQSQPGMPRSLVEVFRASW